MAKMQNPPLDITSDALEDDGNKAGGSSSSKIKQKRRRDESVGAASEASLTMIDSTIGDEEDKPASLTKTKRRRKKRRKGPITTDGEGGGTSGGQVAAAGTSTSAQRHEKENTGSTAGNSNGSLNGKEKAVNGDARAEPSSASATRIDESKDKLKSTPEITSGQENGAGSSSKVEDLNPDNGEKVQPSHMYNEKHKSFMSSLSQSLICQICLDPMFRPHTLAPCGHSACFTCLESWFRAPQDLQAAEINNNEFDPQRPEFLALNSATLLRKRKTCPHCRAHVSSKPMEAWNIKSIVASLFANGLGEDLYPGASIHAPDAEVASAERQPWKGIFREELSALERIRAYENAEMVDGDGNAEAPAGELGIRDEEDGVYRCFDCLHEIWDGVCSHCDRFYPAHLDFDLDPFGDEDVDILDGEILWDDDDVIRHGPIVAGHAALEDNESDGYESSFIDDDNARDDGRPVIDLTRELGRNARNGRRRRAASVIEIISSGDEGARHARDVDGEDKDEDANTDSDGEDDEGANTDSEGEVEEVAVINPPRRGRPRRGPIAPSDDEEDDDEDKSEDEVFQVARRRNRSRQQPVYVSDDEDEDIRHTTDEENGDFHGGEEGDGIRYSDEDDFYY